MKWTEDMDAYFREIVPGHMECEIRQLFADRFGVTLTEGQIGNRKTKLRLKSGTHGGRFEKGQAAWNKGRPQSEWMPPDSIERTKATRYKPGNMPHNARPMGSERIDAKDGYTFIKVRERRGEGGRLNTFDLKHRVIWEQANGCKVPDGHVVMFADGDKRNFDPRNLVLVSRSNTAAINQTGMPYADRQTLENAVAICELERAVRKVEKNGARHGSNANDTADAV